MSKRLNEKDFKHVRLQSEAGKSYETIAKELVKEGYVNKYGKPLNAHNVKHFLKVGGEKSEGRIDGRTSKTLVKEVMGVMSSNLSPKLKEKFLRQLVGA